MLSGDGFPGEGIRVMVTLFRVFCLSLKQSLSTVTWLKLPVTQQHTQPMVLSLSPFFSFSISLSLSTCVCVCVGVAIANVPTPRVSCYILFPSSSRISTPMSTS